MLIRTSEGNSERASPKNASMFFGTALTTRLKSYVILTTINSSPISILRCDQAAIETLYQRLFSIIKHQVHLTIEYTKTRAITSSIGQGVTIT